MDSQTRKVGCSFSFGTAMLLTIVLLVLKYTVWPTIPVWLALLPVGVFFGVGLLFAGVCLVMGLIAVWLDR